MSDYGPFIPSVDVTAHMSEVGSQLARERQLDELRDIGSATRAVHEATLSVHKEVERLAAETAKAQRLAIKVGVATGVVGSVLGGFAGAVAARTVG